MADELPFLPPELKDVSPPPAKGKGGRPPGSKSKPKDKPKPPPLDPETEAEDAVQTVDTIQTFFSPSLAFGEKEREFHKRSVSMIVRHYQVSVNEPIVVAHASASVLMIVGKWTRAFVQWWNKPKAKPEPPKADPPPPEAESVP